MFIIPSWVQILAVPIVIGLLYLDRYVHESGNRRCLSLEIKFEEREKQFYQYQILAAERFATTQTVQSFRKEILDQMSGMNEKLDRLIERR